MLHITYICSAYFNQLVLAAAIISLTILIKILLAKVYLWKHLISFIYFVNHSISFVKYRGCLIEFRSRSPALVLIETKKICNSKQEHQHFGILMGFCLIFYVISHIIIYLFFKNMAAKLLRIGDGQICSSLYPQNMQCSLDILYCMFIIVVNCCIPCIVVPYMISCFLICSEQSKALGTQTAEKE